MRVMVAGATGAVGRRLVRQLLERGHQVIGTSHRPERLPAVKELGAEALLIDGLERRTVGNAVVSARPDAIVNEMTALATGPDMRKFDESFAMTNRLRTIGTRYLIDAAVANGVGRFIAQSYTGWNNEAPAVRSRRRSTHWSPTRPPSSGRRWLPFSSRSEWCRMLLSTASSCATATCTVRVRRTSLIDLIRRRALPIVGGGRGVVVVAAHRGRRGRDGGSPGARRRGCLQRRRRPPGPNRRVDRVPGVSRRRTPAASCAGLAGETVHGRGWRSLDDSGTRRFE